MAKNNEPLEAIKKTKTAPVSDRKQSGVNGEQTEELQESVKTGTGVPLETPEAVTEQTKTSEPLKTAEQEESDNETVKPLASKVKQNAPGGSPDAFWVPYHKAYPKEKAFHITSDKQVFLEKDRGLAVMHQNSLGNGEQVQTIKVR